MTKHEAIGAIRRIRFHGATVALLRFQPQRWQRGLRYPRALYRRDEWLMDLCELVQDLLSFDAGPVDSVSPHLLPEYRRMFRQSLADHLARRKP